MNIYDTETMLEGIKSAKKPTAFLKNNYFPTSESDFYATKKVVVDFESESDNRLAPGVIKEPVPVQRDGFESHERTAPLIAPSMTLSVEQLDERQFNESITSSRTPEDREADYLTGDYEKLDNMITRTEEYMAARMLLDNAYTIMQYVDGYGTTKGQPFSINFYGEGHTSNQAIYTPQSNWSVASQNILSDIAIMCQMLKKRGLPATDVILGASAAEIFMRNTEVRDILDNRRLQLVAESVSPEEIDSGVTYLGRFNANGHSVNIYSYVATYTNDSGQETNFFDANKIAVTAKGMGRTAYGAITQFENGSKEPKTYEKSRVPQVLVNERANDRELVVRSRPLVMPKHLNASISATVL